MGKSKMLTRPRTHVKSYLAFYRLEKIIIIINLHLPCLCFQYLLLYLRPAQKQSCYWNVKWILVSYVLISNKKRKRKNLHVSKCPPRQATGRAPLSGNMLSSLSENMGFVLAERTSFPVVAECALLSGKTHTLFPATVWLSSADMTEEVWTPNVLSSCI